MSEEWYNSIKWDDVCLDCHKQNNGKCPNLSCAKHTYDEWGDIIPEYLFHDDCSDLEEYLEEKRRTKDENYQSNP